MPWNCDTSHQMPVAVWREMVQMYYPNTGWIRLGTDVLDEIAAYRTERGLTSWEETLTQLLHSRAEVLP